MKSSMPALRQVLTIACHGIGGHGDDREMRTRLFLRPDQPSRFESVELRHLTIHKHQWILMPTDGRERFHAVAGHIHAVPELLQHLQRDLLIHRIVVDDKQTLRCLCLSLRHGVSGNQRRRCFVAVFAAEDQTDTVG
jgi:hypothetical protein